MHSAPTVIVPRFQRKRSFDELAWSRSRHSAYDSDTDSSATMRYKGSEPSPTFQPPSKLRCNCQHMGCVTGEVHGSAEIPPAGCEVFLGGSCGSNTWRRDVTVPILEEAGVSFYNPQLEEGAWHSGLIAVEAEAKENANVLMFVVDGVTRGLASMVEVAATVMSGRATVVVVENVPEGAEIAGDLVGKNELKDLNRAREYLIGVVRDRIKAGHNNIELCSSISEASEHAVRLAKALREGDGCCCEGNTTMPTRPRPHSSML